MQLARRETLFFLKQVFSGRVCHLREVHREELASPWLHALADAADAPEVNQEQTWAPIIQRV